MKENLIKAFQLFCNKGDKRMYCWHPNKNNTHYFATDGSKLIRVPINLYQLDFNFLDKPDIDAVIPIPDCNININIEELESKIIPVLIDEIDEKETECIECNGEGVVEWEYSIYNREFECPECNGEGVKNEETTTGKKIINENQVYRWFDITFTYKVLTTLISTAKLLNEQSVTVIKKPSNNYPMYLKCGDCEILLMPFKAHEEDKIIEI